MIGYINSRHCPIYQYRQCGAICKLVYKLVFSPLFLFSSLSLTPSSLLSLPLLHSLSSVVEVFNLKFTAGVSINPRNLLWYIFILSTPYVSLLPLLTLTLVRRMFQRFLFRCTCTPKTNCALSSRSE
jgi:hypothetical protein